MRRTIKILVTAAVVLGCVAIAIITRFDARTYVKDRIIEAFNIPGASMSPTLLPGDHVLVWKRGYGASLPSSSTGGTRIARGDLVVFTFPDDPTTDDDESLVAILKRVIALPGEKVEVRDTVVLINDQVLIENDSAVWDANRPSHTRPDFASRIVPEGHLFLLGDNRDFSKDSRFWKNPFVEITRVKGRAFCIYFSWKGFFSRVKTLSNPIYEFKPGGAPYN